MREHFIKLANLLVGNYELADVWAGFIAACIFSIVTLVAYYGKDFMKYIGISDVFIWMTGVYITMRSGMFLINKMPFLESAKEDLDSVIMGFFSGFINVYLFRNNYKPIINIFEKVFRIPKTLENFQPQKNISKTLLSSRDINNIINELSKKLDGSIVSIAEVLNGGATPQVGKPLYIRAIYSTDAQSLTLWGEKTLMTPNIIEAICNVYTKKKATLDVHKFEMNLVEAWGSVNAIKKVHYYLIGIDGEGTTRLLLLAVNSPSVEPLSSEMDICSIEASKKIKNIINDSRGLFKSKLK